MALNNLLVQLGLNTSGYEQGLNKASGLAGKFAGDLKAQLAGAFTVGAITNFARSVMTSVERMKDLSEQFNISTDDVQRFDYFAKRNGLSMEDFAGGLLKLANLRRDVAKGDKEALKTLNEFGISLAQATDPAFTMADTIDSVSKSINDFGLNTERTAMITDIFGRAGQRLISTLKELHGAAAVKIVSPEDVKTLDDASKKVSLFWSNLKAMWAGIGARTLRGEGFGGLDPTKPNFELQLGIPNRKQFQEADRIGGGRNIGAIPGFKPSSGLTSPSFIGDLNRENKLDPKADQQRARLIRIAEQNQRTLEKIAEKGSIGQATYF